MRIINATTVLVRRYIPGVIIRGHNPVKSLPKPSQQLMDNHWELLHAIHSLASNKLPEALSPEGDLNDPFDVDDDQECAAALRYLLGLARRGVVEFKDDVRVAAAALELLLHPESKLVDPDATCIDRHPESVAALEAIASSAAEPG